MIRVPLIPSVLLASLLCLSAGPLAAQESAPLGPALGHVGPDEAALWLHAPGVRDVQLEITSSGDTKEERRVRFDEIGRGFGVLRLRGLAPETAYRVQVALQGTPPVELRFTTPPRPRAWGKVRFAVGSCLRFPQQPVWKVVAKEAPDLMLLLGDTVYYSKRKGGGADWDSVETMLARQLAGRRAPGLLPLMRSLPTYSVWDDHDYGPNDSNQSFALRSESRLVHRYLWAGNPGFGEGEQGVYFRFRRGPVEFFLLDGRSFKTARRGVPKPEREVFGRRQMEWLKRGLLESDAPLKVIGSGIQALFGYAPAEGWHEARPEREAFMAWLAKHPVGATLFLSGDIHVSELYQKELAPGRNLWELTSSGLAADAFGYEPFFENAKRKERRWVVTKQNVCFVEVEIPQDPQRLSESTLRFVSKSSKDGTTLAETETTFASFGAKSALPPRAAPREGTRQEFK